MNAKLALLFIVAALVSACADAPTWDTSVFPQQMSYGAPGAEAATSVAAVPAK